MGDWIVPGLVVLAIAAFVVAEGWLSFRYGVECGKQMRPSPFAGMQARHGIHDGTTPPLTAVYKCPECGQNPHHADCPKNVPPVKAKRPEGFSKAKRRLEQDA